MTDTFTLNDPTPSNLEDDQFTNFNIVNKDIEFENSSNNIVSNNINVKNQNSNSKPFPLSLTQHFKEYHTCLNNENIEEEPSISNHFLSIPHINLDETMSLCVSKFSDVLDRHCSSQKNSRTKAVQIMYLTNKTKYLMQERDM